MGATAGPVPARAGFNHPKLTEWREASGETREQACARLGVSYPYLTALELGGRMPSVAMVIRLAEGYGHHPGELFCDEGDAR